jgi:hypothetical protein
VHSIMKFAYTYSEPDVVKAMIGGEQPDFESMADAAVHGYSDEG